MKTRNSNRLLALVLCLCMMMGILPLSGTAYAAEPCPNHPAHDAACGYVEAVEGHACGHTHDEACGYIEGTEGAPCKHEHDAACGYIEAVEGHACGHTCELCNGTERALLLSETREATCSIFGRVSEGIINDLVIKVALWQGGEQIKEVTTAEKGRYSFDSLTPGTYTVKTGGWANDNAYYMEQSQTVTLTDAVEGGNAECNFDLEPGSLPGTYSISGTVVVDGTGNLLGDIEMTLWKNGGKIREVKTSSVGEYTFSSLEPGTYTIKASGWYKDVYYIGQEDTVIITDRDVECKLGCSPGNLPNTYSLSGIVKEAGTLDNPESGSALSIGVTLWKGSEQIGAVTTDKDMGAFSFFSLGAGTYTVKTGGWSGGVYYTEQSDTVTIEGRDEDCSFYLEPGIAPGHYTVSGTVRQNGESSPLGGIPVELWQNGTQIKVCETVLDTVMGMSAEFSFINLLPGTYTLRIPAGTYGGVYYRECTNQFTLGDSNIDWIELKQEPGAAPVDYTVSGAIKGASGGGLAGVAVQLLNADIKMSETTTGADGGFTLSNVSNGAYTLRVPAGTYGGTVYQAATKNITVSGQNVTAADLTLAAATDAPSEPGNFTATPGDRQVVLSWTAPASDGGAAITGYEVSSNGGSDWTPATSATGHTFTGLTNGQSYTFQVRAVNSAGKGTAATQTATPKAAPTAPGAPHNFTATPGDKQVSLSWEAPQSNGGAEITGYEVSKDNGTSWAAATSAAGHTFENLTNGQSYTFKVRAINSAGKGAEATATATPQAVPNLTGIASPNAITGIANGTPLADIRLPDQVEITTTEGNKRADVTWNRNTAAYDPAGKAAQTFTISGTVTLPSGVTNTDSLPLTVQISITVAAEEAKVITGIQIESMPNKMIYTEGDALELTGLTVKLAFSKSGEKTVALAEFAAHQITVSPANGVKLTMRDTTVTVSAGGKEASFNITVKAMQQVQPLAFTPVGGTYNSPQSVGITCGTEGAIIYYTTNGGTPTAGGTRYTNSPITVNSTTTIKAVAIKEGMKDSPVATATYTIKTTKTTPPHTHNFGGNWHSDEENHWQLCTADDGAIGNKAAHSASGWIDDKPLSENELTRKHQECMVCGYTMAISVTIKVDDSVEVKPGKNSNLKFYGNFTDLKSLKLNGVPMGIELLTETRANLIYPGYDGIAGIAKAGSVDVTLYAGFLETLPAGTYALDAEFENGESTGVGSTEFTLVGDKKPEPTPDPNPTTPEPKPTPNPSTPSDIPPSGGSPQQWPWVLTMLAALLCGGALFVYSKKGKQQQK